MKGILLAGGSGTRLYPVTQVVSKQLLPVYDKPMVYYPLSTLMLAGIRDILLISTPQDLPLYERLLGDGAQFGLSISYCAQQKPEGLAQGILLGREFIGDSSVCLTLGDNIFYGHGLTELLQQAATLQQGARIFGYRVKEPQRYGVLEFDPAGRPCRIVEKPPVPPSPFAVVGLYFYDATAPELAASLQPSARGELEITDLNNLYLAQGRLEATIMGRGIAWLDTGTHESLQEAGAFIQTIEKRQGQKVACLEEIAFQSGWISADQVMRRAVMLPGTDYGDYLQQIVEGGIPPMLS